MMLINHKRKLHWNQKVFHLTVSGKSSSSFRRSLQLASAFRCVAARMFFAHCLTRKLYWKPSMQMWNEDGWLWVFCIFQNSVLLSWIFFRFYLSPIWCNLSHQPVHDFSAPPASCEYSLPSGALTWKFVKLIQLNDCSLEETVWCCRRE